MTEREESGQNKLFHTELVPGKPGSERLFDEQPLAADPVECLGVTFESENARRTYFLQRLREYLPELRKRTDFPIGEDEDILRLSDPPYYTACPNPFLSEFIEHHGSPYDRDEPYHREPFAVDVSEGKTDPLYRAHSYHTKVPHRAITPSILHYTKPGDVVLDGFCGSGMTGLGTQWCEAPPPQYRAELEARWRGQGWSAPDWGPRPVILGDLSPAATFIAANYNIPFNADAFARSAQRLLVEIEEEIHWMYETTHTDGKTKGQINYTVWSEVFTCPQCAGDVVFLDATIDLETKLTRKDLECPHCGSLAPKEHMDLQFETSFDPQLRRAIRHPKRVPVLLNYTVNDAKYEKRPDSDDKDLLERISHLEVPSEVPLDELPDCQMTRVGRMRTTNTHYVRQMFLPRSSHALGAVWRRANQCDDSRLRNMLLFFVEQAIWTMSLMNRFRPTGYSQVNQYLTGVYYVPSQTSEINPLYVLRGKQRLLKKALTPLSRSPSTIVSTVDASQITAPR